jgi:hypothetical protein
MGSVRCKSLPCLLALALICGCRQREEQDEAEGQSILGVMRLPQSHEWEDPGVQVTNLAQLFRVGATYPHDWHRRLLKFGKHAGFTNSVFEKYIFLPPGITNRFVIGEIVLMNAKPYPGSDGLERSVVSKAAGVYHWGTYREQYIQQLFRRALPNPSRHPCPPDARTAGGALSRAPVRNSLECVF